MEYSIYPKHSGAFNGSSKIGYLNASYDKLVELFGQPLSGDSEKTDAEWQIMLENGHPVAIYNYKNGVAYNGNDGIPTVEITEWSIGGHFDEDAQAVLDIVNGKQSLQFTAKLVAKNREDLLKRLKGMINHIEEGKSSSSQKSDYHSWEIGEVPFGTQNDAKLH